MSGLLPGAGPSRRSSKAWRCDVLGACALLFLLAGCMSASSVRQAGWQTAPMRQPERMLLTGIARYEDGDLRAAEQGIQGALAGGLLYTADKVAAHKYLAFIYCASKRERECREQFAAALALDPKLELTPAEAGHPLWGPVFRSVRTTVAPPG